jgi:hypothetical protein
MHCGQCASASPVGLLGGSEKHRLFVCLCKHRQYNVACMQGACLVQRLSCCVSQGLHAIGLFGFVGVVFLSFSGGFVGFSGVAFWGFGFGLGGGCLQGRG